MRIRIDVALKNADEQVLVRRSHGTEADVRRTTVSGLVGRRASAAAHTS